MSTCIWLPKKKNMACYMSGLACLYIIKLVMHLATKSICPKKYAGQVSIVYKIFFEGILKMQMDLCEVYELIISRAPISLRRRNGICSYAHQVQCQIWTQSKYNGWSIFTIHVKFELGQFFLDGFNLLY